MLTETDISVQTSRDNASDESKDVAHGLEVTSITSLNARRRYDWLTNLPGIGGDTLIRKREHKLTLYHVMIDHEWRH